MSLYLGSRPQRGFSLLVVLILLIVMSILGVAIIRSSAMQERMSANMRDRSLAMQAAESALRFAQNQVLGATAAAWDKKIPTAADCVAGKSICPAGSLAVWSPAPAITTGSVTTNSEYWIEYLGLGPGYKGSCDTVPPSLDCRSPMFRITARSQSSGRADVMLQSVIASRIPVPGA